jgi:CHAT domain-containing protein
MGPSVRASAKRYRALSRDPGYTRREQNECLRHDRSELTLAGQTRLSLARIISPEVDFLALRLVVLSACETGLIEFEQAPDEFLGLPAGFLEAGAPGVVSTL